MYSKILIFMAQGNGMAAGVIMATDCDLIFTGGFTFLLNAGAFMATVWMWGRRKRPIL